MQPLSELSLDQSEAIISIACILSKLELMDPYSFKDIVLEARVRMSSVAHYEYLTSITQPLERAYN
jgi:hypothetical protein